MTRKEIEKIAIEYDRNLKNHPLSTGEFRKDLVEFAVQVIKNNKMFNNVKSDYSKTGIELIADERQRQIDKEGWTAEHDAEHKDGELANAAAYYAMTDEMIDFINNEWGNDMHLHIWPFELRWLKRIPENRLKELQKAGAFIAAEIDRLNSL